MCSQTEDWNAKTIYRVANRNVSADYGTQQDLTSGNNLLYKFNPNDNWTDVGGASASEDLLLVLHIQAVVST